MCVSKRNDIEKIKNLSKQIDPEAFIITHEVHNVRGRGFTLPTVNLPVE